MNPGSVLVTGAGGFLGRELVLQLKAAGWTVYSAVRRNRLHDMEIELDLEDVRFSSCLEDLPRLDAIVHLAAKVDFSASKLSSLFQTNIVATASLAEFARRRGIRLIFASSALVAGARATRILHDSSPNADTTYASSKWIAESLISASGVSGAVLRIGGIFGLNGPSHLGLNRAIHSVVSRQPPELVGSGAPRRNYIYVKDVAATIAEVLRRDITGTHLVAGREILSVDEMLTSLCEVFLPGAAPLRREGHAGSDQLIDPSPDLPQARAFRAALEDMRAEAGR
ncbi:NAD-dependent epimerase/dehydratase family protein [Denitromonas sp.]|uniref:NAD-dependent epimerase/dehydratase family protein n=1 Tax=Denitromonas sp. TaxID=2734609 RepID=UPI002CD9E000|nr:NAD(P)-dependent oxidoreductase [Denitromonas sp.]